MPKRTVLEKRLSKFIDEKLLHPHLPFTPIKILGFGSFFRGKENPHDVDLSIVFKESKNERDPRWEKWWRKVWELDTGYGKLQADKLLLENCKDVPEDILTWMSVYSRSRLFPQSTVGQMSVGRPSDICKRMLKGIPGINVMDVVSDEKDLITRQGKGRAYVTVWTADTPNLDFHLKECEKNKRNLLEQEFNNLVSQYECSQENYQPELLRLIWEYRFDKFNKEDEANLESIGEIICDNKCLVYGYNDDGDYSYAHKRMSDQELEEFVDWIRDVVKLVKIRDAIMWEVVNAAIEGKQFCSSKIYAKAWQPPNAENCADLGEYVINTVMAKKRTWRKFYQRALEILIHDIELAVGWNPDRKEHEFFYKSEIDKVLKVKELS